MEKEPSQQADFIEELSPEQTKINLLNSNVLAFRRLVSLSLRIGVIRLFVFCFIIIFQEQFIIFNKEQQLPDSWNIIFYVIACMMDFLSILNDTTMMKFIDSEQSALDKIKTELANRVEITTQTKIGKYTSYLSMFEIIRKYKYLSLVSISQTVRFLHIILTFYIFANPAINSQDHAEGQTFKAAFLWLFILSIYFNVFEMDFFFIQTSQGKFIEKKSIRSQHSINSQADEAVHRTVKDRYINNCRRPFQILYIINILLMLMTIISFIEASIFNLMLTLCISSHIVELIHEKHLQNKLMDVDLSELPFDHLDCFKIVAWLSKENSRVYGGIRVVTRLSIMLVVMAYFRQTETPTFKSIIFAVTNILLFLGQFYKFDRLANSKLYMLLPYVKTDPTEIECSICLLACASTEKVIQLPCFSQHIYHYSCMKKWYSERKECPLCRYSLQKYQLK